MLETEEGRKVKVQARRNRVIRLPQYLRKATTHVEKSIPESEDRTCWPWKESTASHLKDSHIEQKLENGKAKAHDAHRELSGLWKRLCLSSSALPRSRPAQRATAPHIERIPSRLCSVTGGTNDKYDGLDQHWSGKTRSSRSPFLQTTQQPAQ